MRSLGDLEVEVTPRRALSTHHPDGHLIWSYFKIAIIGVVLSVGVTLANNERTDARVKDLARVAAKQQNEAVNYVINFAACGAYKLVNPTIASNETLILALKRAIEHPPADATPRMTSLTKARLHKVQLQTAAFKAYKNLYRTIPHDFDCKTLPKTPPA